MDFKVPVRGLYIGDNLVGTKIPIRYGEAYGQADVVSIDDGMLLLRVCEEMGKLIAASMEGQKSITIIKEG
jgi:hypothetical protein